MENDTGQKNTSAREIRNRFDQTLGAHIERLMGTRFGIEGLPLNCSTISCLILLMERESEVSTLSSDASDRYTRETLLQELVEIGLDSDNGLEPAIHDLIQKGYIRTDNDGRFFAEKSTLSTVRLFDSIFPKMPGMNFIAYLIQTIDEVVTGRKELEFGIRQFDMTLKMQGVPLKKEMGEAKKRPAPKPVIEPQKPLYRVKPLPKKEPPIPRSGPRILSSDGSLNQVEVREIRFGEVLPAEEESTKDTHPAFEENDVQESEMTGSEIPQDTSAEPEKEMQLSGSPEQMTEPEGTLQPSETDSRKETESVGSIQDVDDDLVDERIASFQEDLALQCPMCKSTSVQKMETGLHKTYYKCPNKNCNFISWGKPHHLSCPKCRNPFLIENTDLNGNMVLKCPRATCGYREKSPRERTDTVQVPPGSALDEHTAKKPKRRKPGRRVVKRRVVRRKKSMAKTSGL